MAGQLEKQEKGKSGEYLEKTGIIVVKGLFFQNNQKMIQSATRIFFFTFLIIRFASSSITFKSNNQISINGGEFNLQMTVSMQSYSFQGNHFVGIGRDESDAYTMTYVAGPQLEYDSSYLTGIVEDQQIRSASWNVEFNRSVFLIFNKDEVRLVRGRGPSKATIYNKASDSKIVINACFGPSRDYVFVLVQDEIRQIHELVAIINSTEQNTVDIPLALNYPHDQLLYNNGTLSLTFQGNVITCLFDSVYKTFSDLTPWNTEFARIYNMHMLVTSPSIFTSIINDKLQTNNFVSGNQDRWAKQFLGETFSAIAVASFKVFLLTENEIIFFDLGEQQQISRVAHGRNGSLCTIGYHSGADKIILYQDFPQPALSFQVYENSASYPCSSCSNDLDCFAAYVLNKNKTLCIKQSEYIPQPEPDDPVEQTAQQQQLVFGINRSTIRTASENIGKGMSVSSLKIMPNFYQPLQFSQMIYGFIGITEIITPNKFNL